METSELMSGRVARMSRWLLRTDEMRMWRDALPDRDERRLRALRQAELLLEVARRVAEPVERLPAGSPDALRIGLYRDAVYWLLVSARQEEDAPAAPDLETMLASFSHDRLLKIAGSEANLAEVQRALIDASRSHTSLETTRAEATRIGLFAEALLQDLDQPRVQLDKLRIQRSAKIAGLFGVVALLVYGVLALARGPNLIADKPFRVSSSWAGCATDAECTALLFHTDPEFNPWIEFDMGKPTKFHRIEVKNRIDCCSERAVPLVIEISDDRARWTEIARQDSDFSNWTVKLAPKTARYLKFHVPRNVAFHLKSVAVR
jgi:hypothetical protein